MTSPVQCAPEPNPCPETLYAPPTRDPGSRFTPGAQPASPTSDLPYLAVGPRGADLERSTLRIEKRKASG